MDRPDTATLNLEEGRFERFAAIDWWDLETMRKARVLVVGAGALGNEVIKNLALLGIGQLAIVDMDRVEASNLSRSVLFRPEDEGRPKADCAAAMARQLYPDLCVHSLVSNVCAGVGMGVFRWADIVVGALDNREARLFLNRACALVGTPWIDGGIEVLNGIVRGFAPPETACYECTMNKTDWELIQKRRSCSLLAQRALDHQGVPTTPTTASVIGAMQAQEVVKILHGRRDFLGHGYFFEGGEHNGYKIQYPIHPECEWHELRAPVKAPSTLSSETPWRDIAAVAAEALGGWDAIDFGREIVTTLQCPQCQSTEEVYRPVELVRDRELHCGGCGVEKLPTFVHCLGPESPLLDRTPAQTGLPPRDIVWPRFGTRSLGLELAGDPIFSPPLS